MSDSSPIIKRLCVIGVGLIGGSLARGLRGASQVEEVVGCGRSVANLNRAVELGVIDRFETSPARAVIGADLVLLAVPMGAIGAVLRDCANHIPDECVITDAGSTKASVVDAVREIYGCVPANFVPGHPIAGTENSGVEASFSELFIGRTVILTPLVETDAAAQQKVRAMWRAVGANVVDMGVDHHDAVLAATSHLPHLLAFTLVDSLARLDDRAEIFRYAAGGFRDFTRIASSDPTMWHDICSANRGPLLDALGRFRDDLDRLAAAVRDGDGELLLDVFRRAKQARDNLYLD